MDVNVRQELHTIIEKLTHSGAPSLDRELVKKVKSRCKQSDAYVRMVYELLMHDLAENHAEIRFSAFQLINELFARSSLFRELLASDFKKFARLVTGTDTQFPLPPPKDAAASLKKSSLLAIREWCQKYSHGYPKLKLGFNYLKFNKKVDFEQLVSQNAAERRRREEREARQRTILQQRIQEVKQEILELKREVDGCLMEMESCFNLLLPRFELPDIYTSNQDSTVSQDGTFSQDSTVSQDRTINQDGTVRQDGTINQDSTVSQDRTINQDSQDGTINLKSKNVLKNRRRTLSSGGSFLSPSEGSGSEEEGSGTEETGVGPSTLHGCSESGPSHSEGSGTKEEGSGTEETASTLHVCSESGPSHGEEEELFQDGDGDEEYDEDTRQTTIPSSDSDSDVEWEDVNLPGIGTGTDLWGVEMQEHGMAASQGFSIPVHLSSRVEVVETEDNSSVIAILQERRQLLIDHHLPTLNKCLEWMSKAGERECVFAAIDLKHQIKKSLEKYSRLSIVFKDPLPEKQPHVPAKQEVPHASAVTDTEWKFGTEVPESVPVADMELDPTTPHAQLAILKRKLQKVPTGHAQSSGRQKGSNCSSKNSDLLSRAPVVPFGMDLYHWENSSSSVEPRTLAPIGSLHRFWAQEKEVVISKDEKERLKCRTISFPGQFQPVMESCRALLPSGKLCPRKDRYKCPFHGNIIPRDEHGIPISSDAAGVGQTLSLGAADVPPLWQDQELQLEVMAAKGIDLHATGGKKGKRKGRKVKFPGLTDLRAQVDTPRKRLEKKVLNKRSLRKVTDSINELATKKYNDKFGNNFNYALKN